MQCVALSDLARRVHRHPSDLARFGVAAVENRLADPLRGRSKDDVEYRNPTTDPISDPALKTVRFQELVPPRRQCQLLGASYEGQRGMNDGPRAYRVSPAALRDAWFRRTGFRPTSRLPDSVGYECDTFQPGCAVPPLTVLFHFRGPGRDRKPTSADAVRYVAPSGASVFSRGRSTSSGGLTMPTPFRTRRSTGASSDSCGTHSPT